MRTTRNKLNIRIYWAIQAQIYVSTCINRCINGYKDNKDISRELNLAYQNLEMSWSNISENVNRKFISSKIRGNQDLINYLIDINKVIGKYIGDLNDEGSYSRNNNHLEIDRNLGKYYHTKALKLLDKILKEMK